MLKEFEIGKRYRVKSKRELLKTEGVTVEDGRAVHKDFTESFFIEVPKEVEAKYKMSELYNTRFTAESRKKNVLNGWFVEPWMCVESFEKEFELPEGLEYVFNPILDTKYIDLIIDGAVKYKGVICKVLKEKYLQIYLNIDGSNKCIITLNIEQFINGKIVVRDARSKMIICPYKIVPTDIKPGDILAYKVNDYVVIGKAMNDLGISHSVLTLKTLDAPIEANVDTVICLQVEDFKKGSIKKLEWD